MRCACIHHLSTGRLGARTRASAVASGFVLVFRTLIHLGLRYVLFLLRLGLSLRQELNGLAVKITSMASRAALLFVSRRKWNLQPYALSERWKHTTVHKSKGRRTAGAGKFVETSLDTDWSQLALRTLLLENDRLITCGYEDSILLLPLLPTPPRVSSFQYNSATGSAQQYNTA